MNRSQQSQSGGAESTASPNLERRGSGIGKLLRWIGVGLKRFGQFLLIAWGALAVYYSNLPWAWARIALAVAFAVFAVWALWVSRRVRLLTGVFAALVVWWLFIPPSHDRPWRPEVAVMPRAIIEG